MLDTHVLIWWVNGDAQLSSKSLKTIEKELANDGRVLISAISAWEIAILVAKGRLVLAMDVDEWLATIAAIDGVTFVPVDVAVAIHSVRLPGDFHSDPADRMIVALARHYSAALITADSKIISYKHVKTIS